MVPLSQNLQEQVRQSVWTRELPIYRSRVERDVTRFMRRWPPASRVMDAGCGDGYGMDIMKAAGHHPVGFDVNENKLAVARQHGHEAVFCNLEELLVPDGSFDVVWCRHVLEHLTNPTTALRCFCKALMLGGVLSLIVPIVEKPTKKHPTVIASVDDVAWWVRDAGFWMSKAELKLRPYGDEVWIWAQRRW